MTHAAFGKGSHLHLIDGSGFIFRAYHALPPLTRKSDGLPIGAVAGFLCYNACNFKSKLGYDDSLDVVGVHGVGGTWGALATGLFATKLVNDAGGDGLFYGNPGQLWTQILAVAATMALSVVGTAIILKEYHGLTFQEIADLLDCPLSTVKTRLYQGLTVLRKQLREAGVESTFGK